MFMVRQGDVFLIAADGVSGTKVKRDKGRIILAYGEVTGHAHAIKERDAELLHDSQLDQRFLQVLDEAGVDLVHEEHDTIHIPTGNYRVVQQREWTPFGERAVRD
jgi:hypothetical protein